MNRWLGLVLLMFLADAAARAGLNTADGRPAGRPAYRISGVAVSSRDGAPIPFCRLRVAPASDGNLSVDAAAGRYPGFAPPDGRFDGGRSHRAESSPAAGDAVMADAHGRFAIDVAKAGAWRLTGIARGYRLQAYEAHEMYSSAIVVTEAAPTVSVTFRLAPDALISGVVFDEAGEPVAAAQVQAEEDGSDTRRAYALTDDRGHYEITGLAPESYRLRVDARPWYAAGAGARFTARVFTEASTTASTLDPSLDVVYPTTWFPGTDDRAAADVLTLSGGENRQADFHLQAQPAAHFSVPRAEGTSTDDERQGWPGPVVVRVGDGRFPVPTGTLSATSATWDVGELAPGTYEVRMPSPAGAAPSAGEVRRFTIKTGGAFDLATAQALVRINLRFDGNAGRRTQVTLVDTASGMRFSSGGERSDMGDFGGRFGHSRDPEGSGLSVPPGTYRVNLVTGEDSYLAGMAAEGAQVSGDTIQITGGKPVLTLRLAAGRAHLSGVATLGGLPSAGSHVLLVPASGDMARVDTRTVETETNSDGSFAVPSVVPGPYILVVLDGGWSVNWRDPATLAGYLEHGLPLDLQPAAKMRVEVGAIRP